MSQSRVMALTPELVQLCFRHEVDPGPDPSWTSIGEGEYGMIAERVDAAGDGGPLWVFAYGSLIWKPEFEAVEKVRATAFGWHRSFCLELRRWRGSPQQPGLMMALERGGQCDGVIYRLPEGNRLAQIERLLRREIDDHESVASVRWLPVRTEQGPKLALGFWVGMAGQGIRRRQPLPEVAQVLARACGHIGSCAEYLYNTVTHLEAFGIHDRNLWQLQALVAEEIRAIHPGRVLVAENA
ncbi:gamma-glutamylcyclotransferase [Rhizobium sp. LjRoot30]|uniref:gamma-glutamylcyclotransferase n=1 Tax=Rhizobium sp. LjRoot30 TaxID=3342320 RepID=UPI003ECCB2F3